MTGDRIPGDNHVARYCRPTQFDNGKVQASSFLPKEGEDYLSVNWLEYFDCSSRLEAIARVRKTCELTLSAGAKFAVLNVSKVCDTVRELSEDNRELAFTHHPKEPVNLSHSGIENLSDEDLAVAELIRTTIVETLNARQS